MPKIALANFCQCGGAWNQINRPLTRLTTNAHILGWNQLHTTNLTSAQWQNAANCMSRWMATLQAASLDEVGRWNILNSNLFSYPNRPPAFPGQPTHDVQPLDLYGDYDTCMDNVVYWGDGGGMDDFSESDSVPCTEYNSEWLQGTATVWSSSECPAGSLPLWMGRSRS